MKVILAAINAKYIHSNPAVKSLYLFSSQYAEYMEICEYTINQDKDYILGNLYEKLPDVVCFSCYLWNIEYVKLIVSELHKILPKCHIWLGGPEVSYDSEMVLQENVAVTGIMRGEGEKIFYELLTHYVFGEKSFLKVPGITYKEGGQIHSNQSPEPLSMDELPFLYEDLSEVSNRIIYYESSRGCPYGCSYCMSSIEKGVRFRSLSKVLAELKYFLDNNVLQVKFLDRTFNISHERTETILQFLLENDNGITNFHFEVSADILSEREIEILTQMRTGLVQLEIGVQTTNPDTLKAINRHTDYEKLKENVRKIQESNRVHCHLDLIAGLPLENLESFKKSFNDVYGMNPHQLQLGFLKVLKGAPMQFQAEKYGIVYRNYAPYEVLYTEVLTVGDILQLKGVEEMVEVYYNSGLFPNTLKCLIDCHNTPFEVYDSLWKYYRKTGADALKHSRISRYEILHAYIKEQFSEEIVQLLSQVLLFDLYSRENLKTRPSFAVTYEKHKEQVSGIMKELAVKYKGKDFHVEVIGINLDKMKTGQLQADQSMVLFDYSMRHPISGMAQTQILTTI